MNQAEAAIEYNKGTQYLNKKNYKKAIASFKKVLRAYPCKEANTNIGNAYRAVGMDSLMFKHLEAALDDRVPFLDLESETDVHALNNLGLAHYMYGRDLEAIRCYNKAVKKKPEFWEAWWNCSTAFLRLASSGDSSRWARGWEMYKARFLKNEPVKLKNKKENLVYWDGITPGSSIIVLTEQGIGDNIMFGRYLPLLAKKFDKVYVQCDPTIETFYTDYYPTRDAIHTCAEVAYPMCSLGEHFPDMPPGNWLYDKNFGCTTFPSDRPNVGIIWAGSSTHANDAYRSVDIRRFHGLAKHCNLYSLTPGFKGDRFVKPLPISSWDDTAAHVKGLDLVIGIDSSVMHLVGSMGLPGFLLQPYKETDFRWGVIPDPSVVSTRSIWYDSIEVFNNPQSWEFVFKNVEDRLVSRFAS